MSYQEGGNAGREIVEGISRFYEMLWIERDPQGKISAVYDRDQNVLPLQSLHRSFIIVAVDGGFTYKGEFIPMEDIDSAAKKRSLNLQRRKHNHKKSDYL